jgi:hypothetical protein
MKYLLALMFIALTGCATGVQMTDAELRACRDKSCAAFTMDEIKAMRSRFFDQGYNKGWNDSLDLRDL